MENNILGQFDINLFEVSDSSSDEENNDIGIIREKRYVRDAINPFTAYCEHEFHIRYRFSKESVMHGLLPLVIDGLTKPDMRGLLIDPVLQLLICLRFYATASFQKVNGERERDLMELPQPTISRIVFRVTLILASYLNTYVKFVTNPAAIQENRRLFKELGFGYGAIGLPSIDGAIDCTHIRLLANNFKGINEIYRNRKGYFSLNVQAIVGPQMEFMDLVPEWPGSQHDSRILQNSRVYMRYQQRELTGMLVGDAGYPALTFLLIPFRNPRNEEEQRYNEIHSRPRIIVERTFGVWKRRFPCLSRGLSLKLLTCTGVVSACAILHNLSLHFKDILSEEPVQPDEIENDEVYYNEPQHQPGDGFIVRQNILRELFH